MNIGAAASASGMSAKMIRHYEAIGLLAPPPRTSSGYRVYRTDDIHRIRFIRRARDLGFAVTEIRDLLDLWNDRDRHSADVRQIAQAHIATLQHKITALQQMAGTLQTLVDSCQGNHRPDCPILSDLAAGPEALPPNSCCADTEELPARR